MNRLLLVAVVVSLGGSVTRAQDMPLRDLLLEGEGWKKVENSIPPVVSRPVLTHSPDRSTTFRWLSAAGRFIEARQTGADESVPYTPYCPLRIGRGNEPRVTGLATDRQGRIYAATSLGVQVFDPTGRLCGVLHAPAPGKMEFLAFDGNQLTVWVGDVKYTRKLNTTGVK